MNSPSVTIIPAQPGFFEVYDVEDEYEVGNPVIAWRIESIEVNGRWTSTCIPLSGDGETDNCVGVQNPDLSVTLFQDANYKSIKDLNRAKFPNSDLFR